MKCPNNDNSSHTDIQSAQHRVVYLLSIVFLCVNMNANSYAFVPTESAIASAKDISFNKQLRHSPSKQESSEFSVALQSRILSLLTRQLIENVDNQLQSSFSHSAMLYKTNTFVVKISSPINSRVRIEIREHGATSFSVIEVSSPN